MSRGRIIRTMPEVPLIGVGKPSAAFIRENNIEVLNVAGSRGSKEPGVAAFVKLALEDAFYQRVEAMVLRS